MNAGLHLVLDQFTKLWVSMDEDARGDTLRKSLVAALVGGVLSDWFGSTATLCMALFAGAHHRLGEASQSVLHLPPSAPFIATSGFIGSTLGTKGMVLSGAASFYLAAKKPTRSSFEPFFEAWFRHDFYPKMYARAQKEVNERNSVTREKSMFDLFKESAATMINDASHSIQLNMWWITVRERCLPHAVHEDRHILRTAIVDLGTPEEPCKVEFWGINGTWMLAPFLEMNFDTVSVLNMLEAAQAAASASSNGQRRQR